MLKVWSFLFHPPQNGSPVKFLQNWMESNHLLMANILKLHEYQTFGLVKIHDICRIWFANNIFSLLRWNKNYFSWFFKGFQYKVVWSLSDNIAYHIGNWPVQCCSEGIKTTLDRICSYAMLSGASQTTLHRVLICALLPLDYSCALLSEISRATLHRVFICAILSQKYHLLEYYYGVN